jgi:hypothetical protein
MTAGSNVELRFFFFFCQAELICWFMSIMQQWFRDMLKCYEEISLYLVSRNLQYYTCSHGSLHWVVQVQPLQCLYFFVSTPSHLFGPWVAILFAIVIPLTTQQDLKHCLWSSHSESQFVCSFWNKGDADEQFIALLHYMNLTCFPGIFVLSLIFFPFLNSHATYYFT